MRVFLIRGGLCPPASALWAVLCGTDRQSDGACFESGRVPRYWSSCELNGKQHKKQNTPGNPCSAAALVKPGQPLEGVVAWGSLVKNTLRSQGLYISTHNCATAGIWRHGWRNNRCRVFSLAVSFSLENIVGSHIKKNGHIVLFRPGCETHMKRTTNSKVFNPIFPDLLWFVCPLACVDKLHSFLIQLQLTPSTRV